MFEKFKNIFSSKDEKRRNENLIAFLIILVITLIIINKILSKDDSSEENLSNNQTQLVTQSDTEINEISIDDNNLKTELEDILSNISGVGEVQVLLTYSETSSISPLYNESISSSVSTNSDGTTTETTNQNKEIFTDSSDEAVIEKYIMPKIEGAIVIAQGARRYTSKSKYSFSCRGNNRTINT